MDIQMAHKLRWGGVFFQTVALTFALIGVSTLHWFVVAQDVPGVTQYSHYAVTGLLEVDTVSLATGSSVSLTSDAWTGTASCSGACDLSSLTTSSCNDLYNNINGNNFNQWNYNTLCPFSQATLAFIVLGLFLTLLAVLTTGLSAVDFISPMPGGGLGIAAFFSFLIAVAVYGGGVGARARAGWWGTNSVAEMGYSYILTVTAMFMNVIGGGLSLASQTHQVPTNSRPKEVPLQAYRSGEWSSQPVPVQQWNTRSADTYVRSADTYSASPTQYLPAHYTPASPPRLTTVSPIATTYSVPTRVSPTTTPRRVHLPPADVDYTVASSSAPFPNQYYTTQATPSYQYQ